MVVDPLDLFVCFKSLIVKSCRAVSVCGVEQGGGVFGSAFKTAFLDKCKNFFAGGKGFFELSAVSEIANLLIQKRYRGGVFAAAQSLVCLLGKVSACTFDLAVFEHFIQLGKNFVYVHFISSRIYSVPNPITERTGSIVM